MLFNCFWTPTTNWLTRGKHWRCFHCGTLFTNPKHAAEHFGVDESATPSCKLSHSEGHLVTYIRKLELELASFRAEDTDLERAWLSKESECAEAVRRAEERGYDKGVQDAKRMIEDGSWAKEMTAPPS